MVSMAVALTRELDRLMDPLPRSVTALVSYLGGSRGAAAELGVEQRTIQRYTRYERVGKTAATRRPGPDVIARLQRAARRSWNRDARQRVRRRIAREGLRVVYFRGVIVVSAARKEKPRTVSRPFTMGPEVMGPVVDLLDAGDEEIAGEEFGTAYAEAVTEQPGATVEDVSILRVAWA